GFQPGGQRGAQGWDQLGERHRILFSGTGVRRRAPALLTGMHRQSRRREGLGGFLRAPGAFLGGLLTNPVMWITARTAAGVPRNRATQPAEFSDPPGGLVRRARCDRACAVARSGVAVARRSSLARHAASDVRRAGPARAVPVGRSVPVGLEAASARALVPRAEPVRGDLWRLVRGRRAPRTCRFRGSGTDETRARACAPPCRGALTGPLAEIERPETEHLAVGVAEPDMQRLVLDAGVRIRL
ncbi:MAG: hypothetical protein QOC75_2921, partial [Pseudonocardiales bacterium]|nr:hypothetical protein [Pseudonocardiales bacterium]